MKSHKANANNDYDDSGNERETERVGGRQRTRYEKESATDAVHNPNDNINANLITVPCLSNMSALVFALPRNCTWASSCMRCKAKKKFFKALPQAATSALPPCTLHMPVRRLYIPTT